MGYYMRNDELAAINRELRKKKKMGCLSFLGILFLIIIATIILLIVFAISSSPKSTVQTSTPAPAASQQIQKNEKESVKEDVIDYLEKENLLYPIRIWRDAKERTKRARLEKIMSTNVILKSSSSTKKYPIGGFSKKDVNYIEAIEALPIRIPLQTKFEEKEWEYYKENIKVKGTLEYADEYLVILKTAKGHEVHLRQDFIFQDMEYIQTNGF